MNRTHLQVILLIAFIGTLSLAQSARGQKEYQVFLANNAAIQIIVDRKTTQITHASYRLAYHCKMVILESLVIAKKSVNLALDTAIESL